MNNGYQWVIDIRSMQAQDHRQAEADTHAALPGAGLSRQAFIGH